MSKGKTLTLRLDAMQTEILERANECLEPRESTSTKIIMRSLASVPKLSERIKRLSDHCKERQERIRALEAALTHLLDARQAVVDCEAEAEEARTAAMQAESDAALLLSAE